MTHDDDPAQPQTGLGTDDGEDAVRGRRPRRGPRKVTPERVHNKALGYLERFASSKDNLRRVLRRWARESCAAHGTDPAEAERMIEAELDRLEEVRLLDDRAYAEARVAGLARDGASRRKIFMKLKEKGVPTEIVEAALAEHAAEEGGAPDMAAAVRLARKRRLGPYRGDPETRAAKRDRDLAALARNGFSYDVALTVIDAEDVEALEGGPDA